MRLRWTKAARFALHAALELARADGALVTSQQIATRYGISLNHLAKVMGQLVRARLARGVRGVGGGYRLARDPGRINLLEVVAAVEGPPRAGCSVRESGRACRAPCALREVLDELEDHATARLREVTLADLVGLPLRAAPARPRRGRRLPLR